jgi:hypothetical protein
VGAAAHSTRVRQSTRPSLNRYGASVSLVWPPLPVSQAEPRWFWRWQPILGLVLDSQSICVDRYGYRMPRTNRETHVRGFLDKDLDIPQRAGVTYGGLHGIAGFVPLAEINMLVPSSDLCSKILRNAGFSAGLLEDARVARQAIGECAFWKVLSILSVVFA